jgi:hypothetical protein
MTNTLRIATSRAITALLIGLNATAAPLITKQQYDGIENGMTYEQVCAIVGRSGEELVNTQIAGYTTVMYSWKNSDGSYSNMNAMFQNGRLISKAEFRLPKGEIGVPAPDAPPQPLPAPHQDVLATKGEIGAPAPGAPIQTQRLPGPHQEFLSTNEIQAAIAGSGKNHHIHLTDVGGNLLRDMAAGLSCSSCSTVEAGIDVYLSDALIALRSELARRQYLPYTPAQEDTQRGMVVFAQGWIGTITTGCQSITRIALLSDVSGAVVEEAYLSNPADSEYQNAFGARINCQTLEARFSMESVERVKSGSPNGEFLIAVFVGTTHKAYTLKRKHQAKLGW